MIHTTAPDNTGESTIRHAWLLPTTVAPVKS